MASFVAFAKCLASPSKCQHGAWNSNFKALYVFLDPVAQQMFMLSLHKTYAFLAYELRIIYYSVQKKSIADTLADATSPYLLFREGPERGRTCMAWLCHTTCGFIASVSRTSGLRMSVQ